MLDNAVPLNSVQRDRMSEAHPVHLSLVHLDRDELCSSGPVESCSTADVVGDLKRNVMVLETRIEELEEELYAAKQEVEEMREIALFWQEECLNVEQKLREVHDAR